MTTFSLLAAGLLASKPIVPLVSAKTPIILEKPR